MKFDVIKTITINAPLDRVYELVADFSHWQSWSPWVVVEPDCSVDVEGAAKVVGHSMSWDGKIIGSGKNTLVGITDEQLDYDLSFYKPWKSQAKVTFVFEPLGEQTKVVWKMDSSMPLFMFFMIKMMKNLVGMDYDRGLRMLKEVAENGEMKCETMNNGIQDYLGFSYVGIQRTLPYADMSVAMQADFEKIVKDVVIDGQKGARHWVCIYPKFDMKNMMVTYIAAISDEDAAELNLGSEYIKGSINNTKALEIKHNGSYEFLGNAWSMGMMTMRALKMKGNGDPFEQYWNSPLEEKPEALKTSIYYPIK